jgi:hypothetical protein
MNQKTCPSRFFCFNTTYQCTKGPMSDDDNRSKITFSVEKENRSDTAGTVRECTRFMHRRTHASSGGIPWNVSVTIHLEPAHATSWFNPIAAGRQSVLNSIRTYNMHMESLGKYCTYKLIIFFKKIKN